MPELPEVETVRRGLAPFMETHRLSDVELRTTGLRFPFEQNLGDKLCGKTITALKRRGKYILAYLADSTTKPDPSSHEGALIMHLGMSGRFMIEPEKGNTQKIAPFYNNPLSNDANRHIHVVFTMETGARILYCDPRRFGMMLWAPRDDAKPLGITHARIDSLGIEPMGADFTPDMLNEALKKCSGTIKDALLNQKIIAGIGNIYACEALHHAGIRPNKKVQSLCRKTRAGIHIQKLHGAIEDVLSDAVKAGGSSLRDYVRADGELGYFQHYFAVYDRAGKPCTREACNGEIRRVKQTGRSSFYCPHCQK